MTTLADTAAAAPAAHPRRRRLRLVAWVALPLVALVAGAHAWVIASIDRYLHDGGLIMSERASAAVLAEQRERGRRHALEDFGRLPAVTPFEEIQPFDADAFDWGNISSQYGAGVLVFDANGDGRPDVYFCQNGRNWTRPTDERGVLLDAPRAQHNALYINMGNDAQGRPVFRQAKDLARANGTYVEEELLIEGYLYPRHSPDDPEDRPARQSAVAVAADFNADGRLDLMVGNLMPGMILSDPKAQAIVGFFAGAEGRKARFRHRPLEAFGRALILYDPRDDRDEVQTTARGIESVAADSLYLNLGDRDHDGLPEWQDVTREAGLAGHRNSMSFAVADVDLDSDLDLFVSHAMDGDYFPAGAEGFAGAPNELFINELAQTGKLHFVERGAAAGVDDAYGPGFPMPDFYRLRRVPLLPPEYSFLFLRYEPYKPEYLALHGKPSEPGEVSWASVFQDVNGDGAPDLWVANDFTFMRLHLNRGDGTFERVENAASQNSGNWMSLAPGDFDGDLHEDLFAANLGGAIFTNASTGEDPMGLFRPSIQGATLSAMFLAGRHEHRHIIVDGRDYRTRLATRVRHSAVLPPDASLLKNFAGFRHDPGGRPFDFGSLDPYEFGWGSNAADVQNDGRLDLYYHGNFYGRGGGAVAIPGTNPGRLFINATEPGGALRLVDLTAEHHVFNILELRYDRLESEGYVYRPAPTKNWPKRDVVASYDRSVWTTQGPRVQSGITNSDLIQTAESGRGAIFADLNGDGYPDLLLRNSGGYDSRSSHAQNLKVQVGGRPRTLPPHNVHFPVPTQYEPGLARTFLNRYTGRHWLRVVLQDARPGRFNRDAIGAVVIVNGRVERVKRAGDGSFLSNACVDLLFGLGDERAHQLEVRWPDRERTRTQVDLDGLADGTLRVTLEPDGARHDFASSASPPHARRP